ncbi:MAG: putative Ig domain-containing protein [Verrucomicrobia bacterium]|nr:putative Ig domain-containing protein [Verrucomicrobiota bacterium]
MPGATAFPAAPFPATDALDAVDLPEGLAVNPSAGLIQGRPTAAGTFAATLVGTSAAGNGPFRPLTILVRPAPSAPVIDSVPMAAGQVGVAFTGYTITATPAATSFVATGLPAGLSLNSATGVISGTPAQSGAFNVTLSASNASGTGAPVTLVITIRPSLQLVVPGS